jgi:hypothetical protein
MKTFIADIIPRIQEYSQKLDNLTLLTNQHWVVVDETTNSKTVYIFRSNKELLVAKDGEVERAKWEYLGNNALLLDLKTKSYLFRHGFFDENILALKIDGKEEYTFLVNETKFEKELNSADRILEFLQKKYLAPQLERQTVGNSQFKMSETDFNQLKSETTLKVTEKYDTNFGEIEIEHYKSYPPLRRDKAYVNGKPAPDGKYKIGLLWYVYIKDGIISKTTFFGIPG